MNKYSDALPQTYDQLELWICEINESHLVTYLSNFWLSHLPSSIKHNNTLDVANLFSAQDHDALNDALLKAKSNPDYTQKIVCKINHDTQVIWLECSICFSSRHGVFSLTAENVSQRLRLESEKDKYLSIISSAGAISTLGHWQLDIKTKSVFWSDEIYHIHGVKKGEYQPELETAIEFYHPDDIDKVRRYVDEAMNKGEDWQFQLRIVRPSGEVRHVISHGSVHINNEGQADYIFGVFKDVTETKLLIDERDLLSYAVRYTTVGLVITDSKRRVSWVNEGFENLTGYHLNEIEGRGLASILQGVDTDQAALKEIKEKLDRYEAVNTEILNYRKDGEPYWNKLIITPVFSGSEVTHFVGVQHNISEEVNAKKELSQLNAQLEKEVQKRTVELESKNKELLELSRLDTLTGTLNRRAFYQQIESELNRLDRNQQPISLAMIDIDYFKRINDKHGHDAGDFILKQLANEMKSEMRGMDTLFRIGGEEFLLLMPETGEEQSALVAERIRTRIEKARPDYRGTLINTTISIGIITIYQRQSISDYLREVDEYLYEAKNNGRNRVVSENLQP